MSEPRTAAEWRERKVVTDLDTEAILSNLAAAEAERDGWRQQAGDARDAARMNGAEVKALREELADYRLVFSQITIPFGSATQEALNAIDRIEARRAAEGRKG